MNIGRLFLALGRLLVTILIVISLLLIFTASFGEEGGEGIELEFMLKSPAFSNGGTIPSEYSCVTMNISPPLKWEGVPEGCVTLALIVDDPDYDVGGKVLWLVWNIDPALGGLNKALYPPSIGAVEGKNSCNNIGYCGPCPPKSETHHYKFTLYALSDYPDVEPGAKKRKLIKAIKDITIEEYTLTGVFGR